MASKFIIKDVQLAEALGISSQKLYDIQVFFDAKKDDEWELIKDKDYISEGGEDRVYTYEGAYAIAEYLHATEKLNFLQRLIEWFTHFKQKLRQSLVKQKIIDVLDSPGKLVKLNNRYFISKKDVVAILSTSHARLNSAFKEIQRTEKPLIVDYDFSDIEDIRYYSLKGIFRISRHLGEKLTRKNRQDWCDDVGTVGEITVIKIFKIWENWQKDINRAKNFVRRTRDRDRCRVTGKKATKSRLQIKVSLDVHHLYSQAHYPHLASSPDNLITITSEIHSEFHSWMGGSQKKCTIQDFVSFLNERYPEYDDVRIWLNQRALVLGSPQPSAIKSKELLPRVTL